MARNKVFIISASITMWVVILASSNSSVALAQDRKAEFERASLAYRDCVTAAAKLFETAGEPVSDTIDAAFIKCANEKAALKRSISDSKNGMLEDFAEKTVSGISTSLRAELTLLIFQARAVRKGSSR